MCFRVLTPVLLLAAACVAASPGRGREATDRPNFIIFLTDDQGWSDVGCFGSPEIATPHFDQLAAGGMRLTSHYVGAPVCGPSRAALMTGCYPVRIGEPGNRKNLHTILHPREITMAEVLKTRGYATALIGKWHLGGHPNDQGFDLFYGTPAYNGYTRLIGQTKFRAKVLRNRETVIGRVEQPQMDQLTTLYTQQALHFIEEHRQQPFLLCLSHNMPHVPLGVSDKFRGKSGAGLYGDVIQELDWSMGQVTAKLAELGLERSTVLVFLSDNGPWIEKQIGDHAGHAEPLRGAKMQSWEGGPRVPCIVRWPGVIPEGADSDAITTTMDWLPTFAGLAGAALPTGLELDGRDLMPLMRGVRAPGPHEVYFYYCHTMLQGVRNDRFKLVLPRPAKPEWMGWWARMIDEVRQLQLHDLREDIGEQRNVAGEHPEVVKSLLGHIADARKELGDEGRIGEGARFHDPGTRRPGIAAYDKWSRR